MKFVPSKQHILIVTDTWHPNVNGVVRTLENVKKQFEVLGHTVSMITPDRDKFATVPLPLSELRLSLFPKKEWVHEIIQRLQPDCIYIATEGPLGWAARRYCNARALNYTTGYHTKLGEFIESFGIPGSHAIGYRLKKFHDKSYRVMAPTQSAAQELSQKGFKNVVSWTRGVDTDLFSPGESSVYGALPHPIFLNVGRVSPEKNLESFLKLDLPGTKVIVGDGPALDELRKKYSNAVFVGKKEGKDLVSYYRGADVFVFPSQKDTFGNVQLEALACGLPVAAYPVTGPKDVLTDPRIGVLDNDLRTACLKALELKQQGCEKDCRRFIEERYSSWEKTARILEENLVDVGAPNPVWNRSQPMNMWSVSSWGYGYGDRSA